MNVLQSTIVILDHWQKLLFSTFAFGNVEVHIRESLNDLSQVHQAENFEIDVVILYDRHSRPLEFQPILLIILNDVDGRIDHLNLLSRNMGPDNMTQPLADRRNFSGKEKRGPIVNVLLGHEELQRGLGYQKACPVLPPRIASEVYDQRHSLPS
jgi:hypothetical protein